MTSYTSIFESYMIPEAALEGEFSDKVKALLKRVREFFTRLIHKVVEWFRDHFTDDAYICEEALVAVQPTLTKIDRIPYAIRANAELNASKAKTLADAAVASAKAIMHAQGPKLKFIPAKTSRAATYVKATIRDLQKSQSDFERKLSREDNATDGFMQAALSSIAAMIDGILRVYNACLKKSNRDLTEVTFKNAQVTK